ncbi:DUF547 domain-containing protein [Seonamhaeicola sp. MEBiC1930]|uniref:DUF547 domain-containing protein n=1 Tax=Seonamhaeicola sp. MEBiC01930 TaxID=2976768 RepID=UPI00324F9A92
MRFLYCIFIICTLISCGGNKQTITTHPKPNPESEISDLIPVSVNTSDNRQREINAIYEKFNQNTAKRNLAPHQLWNELLENHVSTEGIVNYKGFKNDHDKLLGYIRVLHLTIPKDNTSIKHKLAYWINAYNAFTVDLILRHYPLKSIKDIKDPWKQRYWKLGDKWYDLDKIEHDVLRKMNEPRIHFAINCASVSCPKLQNKAFTSEHLEEQLTKATEDFINNTTKNQISNNQIKLSKLFLWFGKDFKQGGSLIDFLNTYSHVKISEEVKKSFLNYNWDLNE